jgi:hypothetical protein
MDFGVVQEIGECAIGQGLAWFVVCPQCGDIHRGTEDGVHDGHVLIPFATSISRGLGERIVDCIPISRLDDTRVALRIDRKRDVSGLSAETIAMPRKRSAT